ncbi:MAG TPA: alpha/beta hydrolase [Gammaproteobacteria bacterium]|nr:alpha/beta hydrolase [Gammaproteobacteria bacterium]
MSTILHTQIMGEGPPLVILHGLFGSWENWGSQAKRLAEHFTVYLMDARNHGQSPHHEAMDYDHMAADVIATMGEHAVEQAAFIGHSMGGKTAMQVALTSPERVSRLVVVDIAPKAYAPHHEGIFEGLFALNLAQLSRRSDVDTQLKSHVDDPNIRAFLLKNLRREGTGFGWKMHLEAIHRNYAHIIGGITGDMPYSGPTLFIKGATSDYLQTSDRAGIAALFPQVTAKTIDGAGHWPHSEKGAVFYKIADDFLRAESQAAP